MILWIRQGNTLKIVLNLSYVNEMQINWMYELGLLVAKTDKSQTLFQYHRFLYL